MFSIIENSKGGINIDGYDFFILEEPQVECSHPHYTLDEQKLFNGGVYHQLGEYNLRKGTIKVLINIKDNDFFEIDSLFNKITSKGSVEVRSAFWGVFNAYVTFNYDSRKNDEQIVYSVNIQELGVNSSSIRSKLQEHRVIK